MAKRDLEPTSGRKTWRTAEVNLVKGTLKARQAEDERRSNAWRASREAELEAVLGRKYDGMDVPGIPELLSELQKVMAPYIAEFDRLFAAAYPAEFAKASIGLRLTPGGILDPDVRERVRREATRHLLARQRYMQASIAQICHRNRRGCLDACDQQSRSSGNVGSLGGPERHNPVSGSARPGYRDAEAIAATS